MPMLAVACPNCRKSLLVAQEHAGQQVRCTACGQEVAVPGPAASVAGCSSATRALPPGDIGQPVESPDSQETVPPGPGNGLALSSGETATVPPSPAPAGMTA